MTLIEYGYDIEWLKINEALRILRNEYKELELTTKDILKNALLFKLNSRYKEARHSSENCISIYFYSPLSIQARVLDRSGDIDVCLNHISFSGYIPLSTQNIVRLLNMGKTSIRKFSIHPSAGHKPTDLIEIHENQVDLHWDANYEYVIDKKKQFITVNESDIEDLVIHQNDFNKLLIKYKNNAANKLESPDRDKNNKCETASINKGKYKLRINRYQRAAANCLARVIWNRDSNIHLSVLKTLWPFYAIFIYKLNDCISEPQSKYYIDHEYFIKLKDSTERKDLVKANNHIVMDWIRSSCPTKNHIIGRPGSSKIKSAENSLKELLSSTDFNSHLDGVVE